MKRYRVVFGGIRMGNETITEGGFVELDEADAPRYGGQIQIVEEPAPAKAAAPAPKSSPGN